MLLLPCKTNRVCLNRGGNRHANLALDRVAIVRIRDDKLTKAYGEFALRQTTREAGASEYSKFGWFVRFS